MRAVQITEFGGPEVLRLVELPDPVATDGFEVVEVSSAGVNYADTHQVEESNRWRFERSRGPSSWTRETSHQASARSVRSASRSLPFRVTSSGADCPRQRRSGHDWQAL